MCGSLGRAGAVSTDDIIDTIAGGAIGDRFPAVVALVSPEGVSVGPDGSIYLAEPSQHRVRRIDPLTGIIDTIAGTGSDGFAGDGGPAVLARLRFPTSAAADRLGNVYICDQSNHRIRRVSPGGIIATVAGNGQIGSADGPALSAEFFYPRAVAVDPADNVLITDPFNQRVRYLDLLAGTVTTVAGTGSGGYNGDGIPAVQAKLQIPTGVWAAPDGSFLIADQGNHRVREVDVNGVIHTIAGDGTNGYGGDGGRATAAKLSQPVAVAGNSRGEVFITDQGNQRLRMVTLSRTMRTVAGTGVAGYNGDQIAGTQAQLNNPSGVAVLPNGDCVIADRDNERARVLAGCDGIIDTLAGISGTFTGDGWPAEVAQFGLLGGVARDWQGNTYIADAGTHRVRHIDPTGIIETIAGTGVAGFAGDYGPATDAQISTPFGVAVDSAGNLFILDTGNRRVRRVDAIDGKITTVAGNGNTGSSGDGGPATLASLHFPLGLAVDVVGNLYIADASGRRVRKVDTAGRIDTIAGTGVRTASIDGEGGDPADDLGDFGPATEATFKAPRAVAVDASGNIYVSDFGAHRVRLIDSNGIIRTLAGTGIGAGSIDGEGRDARDDLGDGGPAELGALNVPEGVAVTPEGDVVIADQVTRRLRLVSDGIISTLGGNGTITWSLDGEGGLPGDDLGDGGPVGGATFFAPTAVFVDYGANLLIADAQSGRVREVLVAASAPPPTPTSPPAPTPTPTSPPAPTPTPTSSWSVDGQVRYYSGGWPVTSVTLDLTGPGSHSTLTGGSGGYSISGVAEGSWLLEPAKTGGAGNGVSALDATYVLQNVAGLRTFSEAQALACDVTGNGGLSPLDAARILQYSLGMNTTFAAADACGSDWLFVPQPAAVPNQQLIPPRLQPGSCQMGAIEYAPLTGAVQVQDFDAILIGDCTGNWRSGGGAARARRQR